MKTLYYRLTAALFWLMSFACVIAIYLALTDVWHEAGSPDFWNGEGMAYFEWRILAIAWWPVLIGHILIAVRAIWFWRKKAKA